MKNYYYLGLWFALGVCASTTLNSQITFQKTFGGSGDDVANWVATTTTGYLVTGYTTLNGNRDGYLLNLDFSGNVLWQKRIGGVNNDQFNVGYQTDGGFLVLGETESYDSGNGDAWILKISPAGTILWSKTIGKPDTKELGYSMMTVSGNRILVGGAQAPAGSNSYSSCFYLLDANGQTIWTRTYSSNDQGNLLRTNYVNNGIIYASGGIETEGGLLKLDLESGNIIDAAIYPGSITEALYYQQPTSDGNLLLCDHTWSATNGAEIRQWVNKITPEGQTLWSKVYSRPNGNLRGRIEAAGDDNFLLTPYDGQFSNNGDAILVKIDGDGNIIWSRNYGRPGLDWLWKSQMTADNGFVSVGCITKPDGNRDILIIKTNADGLVAGCCVPKAGVVAQNYVHEDQGISLSVDPWAEPVNTNNQQVNANLQSQDYCGVVPVEVFNDISLCPTEAFTFQGVDYYAPDEIVDVHPGLFGCDTTIHYNLTLLPQVSLTQTIVFCDGEAVTLYGQNYYAPDTVVRQVSSPVGCDTIFTFYLQFDTNPANCLSCKGTYLKIVGDEGQNPRGHGVYDAGDGNLYITGTKQDSALILKMTPSGSILWSRTFDIVPGAIDNIAELLVDSDGMLAGCGQSGDVQPIAAGFAFRYDPVQSTMLWTKIITTGSPFVMGIMEIAPGGNYLLNSNPHEPFNNAQLTEISRATGDVVPGPLTKLLDVGGADNFNSALITNGKMYGVGRFTGGNQFTDMRHTNARIDLATGQLDYMWAGHFFIGPLARLYGMDLVIWDNNFVSVGYGDETGEDLNNSKIFLYNDDLELGQANVPHRIDIQAITGDAVDEIVRVPDGYILLCHSIFNSPQDLFLVKVNELAMVVWSKKIDFGNDQLLPVSIVQSQILAKNGFLYCVATTTNSTGEQRMMILKISQDGKMDGDCNFITDTPVTSELLNFSTGQGLMPVETPITDSYASVTVPVSKKLPAAEYFCRKLVDDLVMVSLCPGASITIGGQTYNTADTVVLTLTNGVGCDSIITYVIELLPQLTRAETIEFCPGDVVVIGGESYTASGTVIDTIPGITGCDTIVTYTLIRLEQPVRSETIEFCPGDMVVIGGESYTNSGTVIDTIPGITGCDTIVTYTLIRLPYSVRSETIEFCPGDVVVIGGESYTASGTVIDTIPGTTGCDTIVTYTLIRLPYPVRSETLSFCPGESVVIGGQNYNASGTVIDTIPGITGCDTIVTYTLIRLPYPVRSETIEFCPGEQIVIGGLTYTHAGVVVDTIPGAVGCDTIVTYTLVSLTPAPSVVTIHCPNNVSVIADAGTAPLVVNYNFPTAASDCPCPGLSLNLTAGLPSGAAFPNGITQVCYTAKDSCGHSASCCFSVTIREIQPCDVKVNGCIRYELLSITADPAHNLTYRIRVINNCANKLIYTAIQLPDAVVALEPDHLTTFTADSGREYEVRNPNYSPFYSIRFKSTNDSIFGGQSEIFEYTLPAQSEPTYIDITSRLAPQLFYEAHLNTFYCPIGITPPSGNRNETVVRMSDDMILYPNPTEGKIWVEMSIASGRALPWRIYNSQGQEVLSGKTAAGDRELGIELPATMANGLFFLEVLTGEGARKTARFVLQR